MRTLIILLAALALSACATGSPIVGGGQLERLEDITEHDALVAIAIAQHADDPAGVACAGVILSRLEAQRQAAPAPAPAGVLSAFMAARELRRKIDGAGGESADREAIHNACAPLILDAAVTITKLGLKATPGGDLPGMLLRR